MINSIIKKRLMNNWGPKADAMACNCEVKLYDKTSSLEWFLYALDPEDEDTLMYITSSSYPGDAEVIQDGSLGSLMRIFNHEGEGLTVDKEFRPQEASKVYKRLMEGKRC